MGKVSHPQEELTTVFQKVLLIHQWATLQKIKYTEPCQALGFKSLKGGSVHTSDSRCCFDGSFKVLDLDGVKSGKGGREEKERTRA